jgi:carboxymethylenebutenolidase
MISLRRALSAFAPTPLCLAALVVVAPAAPLRVLEQSVDYPGSEGEMPAHLYAHEGPGLYPGVLVLHTIAGPGPNLEAFARRLAGEGFVTMTPDLFALHDFGPDSRVDHPLVLRDLDGALAYLRAHPTADGSRLGAVGFSFGGRLAVIAAAKHPDLKAAVVYYAVASFQEINKDRPVDLRALQTRPVTEIVGSIHAPVQIHHGEADRTVPARQGRLLYGALQAAGKPSTLYLYPSADHLFNFSIAVQGVTPDPAAGRLAWQRTVEFLKRYLSR